jgi:hypothetical protein
MKVGDTKSDSTMQLIADFNEYASGYVRLNHPRHGVVRLVRRGEVWVVTHCQWPEGKPK